MATQGAVLHGQAAAAASLAPSPATATLVATSAARTTATTRTTKDTVLPREITEKPANGLPVSHCHRHRHHYYYHRRRLRRHLHLRRYCHRHLHPRRPRRLLLHCRPRRRRRRRLRGGTPSAKGGRRKCGGSSGRDRLVSTICTASDTLPLISLTLSPPRPSPRPTPFPRHRCWRPCRRGRRHRPTPATEVFHNRRCNSCCVQLSKCNNSSSNSNYSNNNSIKSPHTGLQLICHLVTSVIERHRSTRGTHRCRHHHDDKTRSPAVVVSMVMVSSAEGETPPAAGAGLEGAWRSVGG